jgi:hypothetical protein
MVHAKERRLPDEYSNQFICRTHAGSAAKAMGAGAPRKFICADFLKANELRRLERSAA